MNIKQKIMKEKDPEQPNNRYHIQNKNYDSTPALMRVRQHINRNKENNNVINHHNFNKQHSKTYQFDAIKSSEFPKRLKTSINEHQFVQLKDKTAPNQKEDLRSSQEFFKFRHKNPAQRQENYYGGQHMTFGEVNQRRGLVTSRQFIQQKRMKNQVIDEIITNTKRGLCKSFNQFTLGAGHCVNHPNKKAKYRLISQLGEGEQQMFYCSKCAINLLQQNFKIQQIKCDQPQDPVTSSRLQLITKFEQKLHTLQESALFQTDRNDNKQELQMIQEEMFHSNFKFNSIIELMEKMKNQWIAKLNELYVKKQNEQKTRRQNLNEIMNDLKNIQQEIKQYKSMKKFALMKQNEFQFITTSLSNKINKFDESMEGIRSVSPCQRLEQQNITQTQIIDKLKEQVSAKIQNGAKRRQRQITFSRRSDKKQNVSEDQFTCDELKRPFRVLFPSDELQQSQSTERFPQKNKMLNSVKERPTFGQID